MDRQILAWFSLAKMLFSKLLWPVMIATAIYVSFQLLYATNMGWQLNRGFTAPYKVLHVHFLAALGDAAHILPTFLALLFPVASFRILRSTTSARIMLQGAPRWLLPLCQLAIGLTCLLLTAGAREVIALNLKSSADFLYSKSGIYRSKLYKKITNNVDRFGLQVAVLPDGSIFTHKRSMRNPEVFEESIIDQGNRLLFSAFGNESANGIELWHVVEVKKRVSEGWKIVSVKGHNVIDDDLAYWSPPRETSLSNANVTTLSRLRKFAARFGDSRLVRFAEFFLIGLGLVYLLCLLSIIVSASLMLFRWEAIRPTVWYGSFFCLFSLSWVVYLSYGMIELQKN